MHYIQQLSPYSSYLPYLSYSSYPPIATIIPIATILPRNSNAFQKIQTSEALRKHNQSIATITPITVP